MAHFVQMKQCVGLLNCKNLKWMEHSPLYMYIVYVCILNKYGYDGIFHRLATKKVHMMDDNRCFKKDSTSAIEMDSAMDFD